MVQVGRLGFRIWDLGFWKKQIKNLCALCLPCREEPTVQGVLCVRIFWCMGWVSFNHLTTQPFNNSTLISSLRVEQ